ncbi:hypothetical protein IQ219_16000 [Synechocystis sp. LEGE 06083]|nr:hypothetical protein [Synechocystis sp. LEGE 06083]MBE9196772.1 hypothetical protein [Synechocystis sp. LEGE 06083]
MSGTLEIEAETERLKHETEQIRKETEQIKKDNERLAVLEAKIDTLFCKHGINLPPAQTPEQP